MKLNNYTLIGSSDMNFVKDVSYFTIANLTRIKNIKIPVSPISEQNSLINKIEKQEKIIEKAKKVISTIAERKQANLDKYL